MVTHAARYKCAIRLCRGRLRTVLTYSYRGDVVMSVTAKPTVLSTRDAAWTERFSRWRQRNRQSVEGWLILTPILSYY